MVDIAPRPDVGIDDAQIPDQDRKDILMLLSAGRLTDEQAADALNKLTDIQQPVIPLTPEEEAFEALPETERQQILEVEEQRRRERFVTEEPGILRNVEKAFTRVTGERLGIDPENLPEFRKALGIFTPAADAGAIVLEGFGGGIAAGVSLAADLIDRAGVDSGGRLRRELLAFATETPILGGITQVGRLPSLARPRRVSRREAARPAPQLRLEGPAEPIREPPGPRLGIEGPPGLGRAPEPPAQPGILGRINEQIDRVFPPEARAESLLGDTLKLDQITPISIKQRTLDFEARNARKPTLLELGGENIEALARKVGGEIGEGRAVIENFRTNVLEGQTQLVKDIAERTLVQPKRTFLDDVTNLERQMQRQAQPLYDAAFRQTVTVGDDIKNMIKTPAGEQAIKRAQKILRQEGKDPEAMGIVKVGKKLTVADDVSVEALDAIKRGFDDLIEVNRDTTTGRLVLDQFGRATNKTRATFRDAVDELSPVYKEARDAFAGPATLKNALLEARDAAKKPSIGAEKIRARLKDMTASEREFYRSGFMRGLIDVMESAVTDVNRVRKLVRSEGLVDKLEAVFDNKEMAQQFVNQLREAEKLSARAQRVSSIVGSQTALRQADIASFGAMGKAGILTNVVKFGFNRLRQNRNIRNEQIINKDIAELLTQPLTDDVLEKIATRLQEKK